MTTEQARNLLQDLLPNGWAVGRTHVYQPEGTAAGDAWIISGPGGARETVTAIAKKTVNRSSELDSTDSTGGRLGSILVAPWIGPAMRAVMDARELSYIDTTGNIFVRLRTLPVFIKTTGAESNPWPSKARPANLRGSAGLRVVRALTDTPAPVTVTEISAVAQTSMGHTSRILAALEEQGLIERDRRKISKIHWAELLREKARQSPPLLKPGNYAAGVARQSLSTVVAALEHLDPALQVRVTGSAAATAVAPLTEVAQLMVWTSDPLETRKALSLLPAKSGGNVIFLEANESVVLARPRLVGTVPHVALSQLVLDCLAGNGRLPSEGEEVLKWMTSHESEWRPVRGTTDELSSEDAVAAKAEWSEAAVTEAFRKLSVTGAEAQLETIRAAVREGGRIERAGVYQVAGYPPERTLRGFTRPLSRVTDELIGIGLLNKGAENLLIPDYEGRSQNFQKASGFRVPESAARYIALRD